MTEVWTLPTQLLGKRVLVFETLASTNAHAAQLAHEAGNDGVAILARLQTAGRGQHARTWQAPADSSVLLSVLHFPPTPLKRPALLTAWAAVAVCRTIRQATGLTPRIKWPNDVYLGEKKVCGILIEQGVGTVTGIGLNLNQSQAMFEQLELPFATSLSILTGRSYSVEELARALLAELDAEYLRLLRGELGQLESAWREHLELVDEQVYIECQERSLLGIVHVLSWQGLQVQTMAGDSEVLALESIVRITRVR